MDPNQTLFSSVILDVNGQKLERYKVYNVCIDQPQKIISDGIWANHATGALPSQSAFTLLELQIIIIFVITQAFHFFLKRLRFPYFVSQVMAGFLLGPSIPTGPLEKYKQMLFPFGSPDIINLLSSYGYMFFLFLNSVQMDFTLIRKTGKKAWVLALTSFFVPVIIGYILTGAFASFWEKAIGLNEALGLQVIIISHSGCSFAVVASLLTDLQILNSELGRLALSTSFLIDIAGNLFAGIGTTIMASIENGMLHAMTNLGFYIVFVIVIPLIGRPMMRWVVRKTPEGRPVNKIYLHIIIVTAMLLGPLAMKFMQPVLAGAVVLGLVVPEGPPLGSELVNQIEMFATWFLTPIFVTCCTMKVELNLIDSFELVFIIACFIVMVHLLKVVMCMGICQYCSMPSRDGFCLALLLSCKGVVEVVSFILVYDALRHSHRAIGILIISVLIMGTISRIGVKSLYDPSRKYANYQKRNIMNTKHHAELRLVACIHKPSHVVHIKNLLELCSPAPDNALVVDVLHLMELIGRTTPIFIAHRFQQKVGSNNYSGEVIVAFDLFERDYAGSATANTYTAISPMTFMHEDVCHLALDKNASLIILPFHIRWAEDGSIDTEDNNIRSLNSMVLERAPCSVAILVNRGTPRHTNQAAAMVFLGGPDDREALCFAKRFAKNLDNRLCVYRLLAHDHDSANWEHMIDDEELREVRGAYAKLENVTYEEIIISDASQTMNFVKDIATIFDFIVVGRRNGVKSSQTSGLENWTEFPELGVIGDLLASPDTETKASILIVQQQQQMTSSHE